MHVMRNSLPSTLVPNKYYLYLLNLCKNAQITVYQNQRIYMELSKEHDKLCASLTDAKKMQDRNKLFAVISHEIKIPLNLIQGFSKEIEDYKPDVPSEAKAIAKHISEASSHILDILSELLELFRLKSNNYWTIRCSPMDLHAFWATTCEKVNASECMWSWYTTSNV